MKERRKYLHGFTKKYAGYKPAIRCQNICLHKKPFTVPEPTASGIL